MIEQQTLSSEASVSGVGLHSGLTVKVSLKPAPVDHGIRFRRSDVIGQTCEIIACVDRVTSLSRATTLSNETGHSVATVEHLMSACRGLGIDNLLIEIDGPEVPIMDGSAVDFCSLLKQAGIVSQSIPRTVMRILRPVEVISGAASARLVPSDLDVLSVSARIEFEDEAIGMQETSLVLTDGVYCDELSGARTFGRTSELESLRAQGLALGGSLENAILVDGDKIVNPGGLRYPDEFVRHKLLDAIGDLALAGAAIAGHYEAVQPGHRLNIELLQTLLAAPDAWCWETLGERVDVFTQEPVHDAGVSLQA